MLRCKMSLCIAYQVLKNPVPRGTLDRRRPVAAVVSFRGGEVGDDAGGEIANVNAFRVHQLTAKPDGEMLQRFLFTW